VVFAATLCLHVIMAYHAACMRFFGTTKIRMCMRLQKYTHACVPSQENEYNPQNEEDYKYVAWVGELSRSLKLNAPLVMCNGAADGDHGAIESCNSWCIPVTTTRTSSTPVHTHTYKRTNTQTHTHMHPILKPYSHVSSLSHTHTHIHTYSHTHKHTP
jgi:hypothetical protein